jgi:hypothetical protein
MTNKKKSEGLADCCGAFFFSKIELVTPLSRLSWSLPVTCSIKKSAPQKLFTTLPLKNLTK